MGRKKRQKKKELLELENLELAKREKLASIISTIVITIAAVITAVISWFGFD
jgi:hypothetical protein